MTTVPNELAKLVGRNIQTRRRELGLTQAELAERVGFGQQALSRMERGTIEPKFERIQDLAVALRWLPCDFFHDPQSQPSQEDSISIQRIAECMRDLRRPEKEAIVRLARDMAAVFKETRSV
jgi:Predicted transcriptional regulator with C-terminal CBS domains